MTTARPPWHLWGESRQVKIAASAGIVHQSTSQLARIAYGRPETWSFMFAADVLAMTEPTSDFQLDIFFDLILGIGLTNIKLPDFEHYQFASSGGFGWIAPRHFWSTEVISSQRVQSLSGASSNPGVCRDVAAESIQCNARVSFSGGSPTNIADIELTAQFAPRTHIRPEWYAGDPQGLGGT